jgi:hypothetical protein
LTPGTETLHAHTVGLGNRFLGRLLGHLRQLPGETWQDRWALFEGQVGYDALTWRLRIAGGSSKNTKNRNEVEGLNAAMGPLLPCRGADYRRLLPVRARTGRVS